jgi:hypothetical protein
VKAADLAIRGLRPADRATLKNFRCNSGEPWEEVVEQQLQGPLPGRYLDTPPYFDGRMLLGFDTDGQLLVVGAHHIEPGLSPDVGYIEVIAVALEARGVLVELPQGERISLGHFMMLTIFRQMVRLRRHRRTFVRVDRRNARSLALVDRVGLTEERSDRDRKLVQRWGELPRSE